MIQTNNYHFCFVVFISLCNFILFPNACRADQKIEFHHPNANEKRIIWDIFLENEVYHEEITDKNDPYYFTPNDVDVAEVNLDDAKIPEIVTTITKVTIPEGNAGPVFEIWKKVGNKWLGIFGDNLEYHDYFYLTDQKINGFAVIRLPDDPNERVYDGTMYQCPKCPDHG